MGLLSPALKAQEPAAVLDLKTWARNDLLPLSVSSQSTVCTTGGLFNVHSQSDQWIHWQHEWVKRSVLELRGKRTIKTNNTSENRVFFHELGREGTLNPLYIFTNNELMLSIPLAFLMVTLHPQKAYLKHSYSMSYAKHCRTVPTKTKRKNISVKYIFIDRQF